MDEKTFSEDTYMSDQFDVVVVGSGPAGVHAAYPLIKAGLRVAIIDGGLEDSKNDSNIGNQNTTLKNSHALDLLRTSGFIFEKTDHLLRIKSNIEIVQSLAKGGLSTVWHGICDYFSESELEAIGLPPGDIKKEYKEIAKLINLKTSQPLDLHGRLLLKKAKNIRRDYSLYQVPSVFSYNTSLLLEKLKRHKNFVYIPGQLVKTVKEKNDYVEIKHFSIDRKEEKMTGASFLILAAGSINTTRILLRSLNLYNYKTRFLTKANFIVPCLHISSLGKNNSSKESKYGQLVIAGKGTNLSMDSFYIQLYKLNPHFLFKAVQYISLPKIVILPLLSKLAPHIVVVDIRFPNFESKMAFSKLKKKGKEDVLEIFFKESKNELLKHKNEYTKINRQLWSLGLLPLRTITGYTTSHYGGGVSNRKSEPLSVGNDGKLNKTSKIYVADSSSWRMLPAKPPTMTIMANASWVGKCVLKRINENNA